VLVETTELPFSQVAFGAGFASIRQFNDTVREVFAATPTELRRVARRRGGTASGGGHDRDGSGAPGVVALRLPVRQPFDGDALLAFLGRRAVAGIEQRTGDTYRRTLRLPHGSAVVELVPRPDHVACRMRLTDLRDLTQAVQRSRRLLDLDADPVAVGAVLGADPLLAPLVAKAPGLRSPGHVDGAELALRAVLGQQISLSAASTHTARLIAAAGPPLPVPDGGLTHLFPEPATIAELDDAHLAMPDSRRRTLRGLAARLADGTITIDPGTDRTELERQLTALHGVGPWTAAYVALRGLGDPDVFLPSDLGVRRALEQLGRPGDPRSAAARAESWRPWRSYALHHLWASLS